MGAQLFKGHHKIGAWVFTTQLPIITILVQDSMEIYVCFL